MRLEKYHGENLENSLNATTGKWENGCKISESYERQFGKNYDATEARNTPSDDLRLQFEALSQFDEEERKIAKALLESLILKHNARRAFADDLKPAGRQ